MKEKKMKRNIDKKWVSHSHYQGHYILSNICEKV